MALGFGRSGIDWKWFIIGVVFSLFVLPFLSARLSRGARTNSSRTV